MKCNNCGAPLQLNQKFCPNCGSPNEQALKHVNDMENYDKKFNRTRSKVISNSKWFVKNITPIAVVMLSAILLIISIAPIADTAAEIYRVKGRYAGYEEESLFNDFIEKDYAGLSKKVNYNKGIGKSISEDEKDYYTFVECYNIAVDYNMYVRLGDINKADELKEQFEDNTRLLQRKIFKEALETVKNTYIVVS